MGGGVAKGLDGFRDTSGVGGSRGGERGAEVDVEAGELDCDGDEGLVGFEADSEGGEDAGEGTEKEVAAAMIGAGSIQCGCQDVREAEDGGEVVALAEVAGRDDAEGCDEGKGEPAQLVTGE